MPPYLCYHARQCRRQRYGDQTYTRTRLARRYKRRLHPQSHPRIKKSNRPDLRLNPVHFRNIIYYVLIPCSHSSYALQLVHYQYTLQQVLMIISKPAHSNVYSCFSVLSVTDLSLISVSVTGSDLMQFTLVHKPFSAIL